MDTLPLVSPDQVGLSAARLARISAWMKGWVDSGKLPGLLVAVMRKGELAFAETYGKADVERNKPVRPDTIYRIYSMTKPLTSTAIMMLYEEGRFQLDNPISRFIPAFPNSRVCVGGSRGKLDTVPAERDITFRDLLTHTSGLTYGFMEATPVDALYRSKNGIDFQTATTSLKEVVEKLATFPLIAQPGKAWNYSVSTDVLGYLVEVISGQPFEKYLVEKVIKPLGMVDTDFFVPDSKHDRFSANYQAGAGGKLEVIDDPTKSRYLKPRTVNSGGGGLVSTASDYLRFCKFMLNKGQLDGVRLLGRMTVDNMFSNHIGTGKPVYIRGDGYGFGLGAGVLTDPAKAPDAFSIGTWSWGGADGTIFYIDPQEDLVAILMVQLNPYTRSGIRPKYSIVVSQAITDSLAGQKPKVMGYETPR